MEPFSGQSLHPVLQRFQGPGHFRLIVQPAIAIFLGVRDGILDAGAGRPPYFWHLVFDPKQRRELWRHGLAAISKPLILAVVIDSLFQVVVLGRWNPIGALVVGVLFVGLPYAFARGLANRIYSRKKHSS